MRVQARTETDQAMKSAHERIDKLMDKYYALEDAVRKLKQAPVRCELRTHEKLKDHTNQLFIINARLKPYKKEPPLVFQTAR